MGFHSCFSPLRHPVADAQLGEDAGGVIGVVAQLAAEAPPMTARIGRSSASVIQQAVSHGPDHDLLLRAKTQLALYAVEAVPDGHRLDPPGLRNRVV